MDIRSIPQRWPQVVESYGDYIIDWFAVVQQIMKVKYFKKCKKKLVRHPNNINGWHRNNVWPWFSIICNETYKKLEAARRICYFANIKLKLIEPSWSEGMPRKTKGWTSYYEPETVRAQFCLTSQIGPDFNFQQLLTGLVHFWCDHALIDNVLTVFWMWDENAKQKSKKRNELLA